MEYFLLIKDVFKVLSYQAESAMAQGDFQKTTTCIQRCKDILMRLPNEASYLSLLCYNFGVETYQRKNYEQSSFWLSQSYEIGKMDVKYSTGKEMQAKVLRLLATVYLEWDCRQYHDKALRAAAMANEEDLHPAGFLLKLKILLKGGASDEDKPGPFESHCLCILREAIGFDFLKSVARLFEDTPDVGRVILLHIKLLLQRMKEPLAKRMIEDILAGLANINYSEALQWYNYSLGFYSSGQMDHQNLAKLHRNMAACYLQLQDHDKAHKAIKEAESYDPSSIFTQFYVYKIAVLEHNTQKGKTTKSCGPGFSSMTEIFLLQTLKAPMTFLNALNAFLLLMHHIPASAYDRLDRIFRDESKMLEMRVSEAQWFRKIAWNLAVQCENCPRIMRDFFIMSFKFSQLCPSDKGTLLAQRTCLLMAAAVDLDIARKSSLPDDQIQLLRQALERIQSCREIWKFLKQTGDFPKDPTDTILLLYEFEARAKLSDPTVADLLDQMWELSQVDIKMLETMAALAMESPAHYPSVCKKALKMVLTLLRQHEALDTVTFSKCLHSLVHLSLPSGIIEAGTHTLEEAWGYFEDALSILGSVQADYPEVEILWLMTQAWNTGIYQYCAGKYPEAERWCGLGMRFLAHLGTLKSNYENQVKGEE
uniref:Protein ZIP4 homolog n=1 Tax=Anolis carolinensis TaxID=28377 RepID=H9GLX6_ANOCA